MTKVHTIAKELFFKLVPKPRLSRSRAVILMYHSISESSEYFSSISVSDFEKQMAYLAENKYSVISLAELVSRLKTGEPLGGSIVITLDDGYEDNYTAAYPILKKHNFPATIFVTTDLIGKADKRNLKRMSIGQLQELEASGLISIEPHSKSHPKLATLSRVQAEEEILGSKKTLEELLGKTCRFFATPYGNFSAETVDIIRANFEAATTVSERTTVGKNIDLLCLPRMSIDRSTSWAQFRGKLSVANDWYERLKI